jgi:hypothetical protein
VYLPRIREGMFLHIMTCVHHEGRNEEVHGREMTLHQCLFTMKVNRPNPNGEATEQRAGALQL